MKKSWSMFLTAILLLTTLALPTSAWAARKGGGFYADPESRKPKKDDTPWDLVGAVLGGCVGLTLIGLQVMYKQARLAARQRKIMEQAEAMYDKAQGLPG